MYNTPLLDLVYKAASVHRMYNDPQMVRLSPALIPLHCCKPYIQAYHLDHAGSALYAAQHQDRWLP